MRRRLLYVISAIALAGPLVLIAYADSTGARPLCGKETGRSEALAARGSYAAPIRVATFNVLHGLTDEGDATLEARTAIQINQLAASKVDVVGLQEASETARHGRVVSRLAKGLAAKTGVSWYWCWFRSAPHAPGEPETRDGGGGPLSDEFAKHYNSHDALWYEGPAVLSRYPIAASDAHRLPGEDRARLTEECAAELPDPSCALDVATEARTAVWALIVTARGSLSFTSTHTSGNVAQHRELVSWATEKTSGSKTAVIVCDCNSLEGWESTRSIRDAGWVDTYRAKRRDAGRTSDQQIRAAKETTKDRIDYVFLRKGSKRTLADVRKFMNVPTRVGTGVLWPSDHLGVIATLT